MKFKTLTTMLAAVGIMSVALSANAQSLTLRVEPGASIPLTDPQAQHFKVGGSLAVKPELGIGSYFSLGPAVQFMGLPSNVSGVDAGTAWSYGGFARVKRPHDEKNTGHDWSAVSPWVDADAKVVRTDSLNRFGWAAAVGASVPTSDSRWLWVGPFARYDVVYNEDGKPGINTNSAKVVTLGLSFEFGAPQKHVAQKEDEPVEESKPKHEEPKVETKPEPEKPAVKKPEVIQFKQRVQFAWDSPVLRASETTILDAVLKAMLADKDFHVKIDGHASSEGQVEHNNKLSQKRADSVMNWLASHGVPRDRMTATGFGSSKPVADNKTEAGRMANRRVEFDVVFTMEKK